MKKLKYLNVAAVISLLCLSTTLTACAGHYVISTNDGHMITTHGKPVTDKDTGLISYQDEDGNVHQLHKQDVKEIVGR